MHPLSSILGAPDLFIGYLIGQIEDLSIRVSNLELDHICYRVETLEDYEILKSRLLEHGKLLSDKIIGGREIAVIQMNSPYPCEDRAIDIIELPAPKPGSPYQKGYEHVEFVTNQSLHEFIGTYPKISFDLKGISKPINADVRLQLTGCSVKFHQHSLKYVIEELEG